MKWLYVFMSWNTVHFHIFSNLQMNKIIRKLATLALHRRDGDTSFFVLIPNQKPIHLTNTIFLLLHLVAVSLISGGRLMNKRI